jgi:hypothetical protein
MVFLMLKVKNEEQSRIGVKSFDCSARIWEARRFGQFFAAREHPWFGDGVNGAGVGMFPIRL